MGINLNSETLFTNALKKGQVNVEISKKNNANTLAKLILNSITGLLVLGKNKCKEKNISDIIGAIIDALD